MSSSGADRDLVAARTALLDALDALQEHHGALVLIGAQAIYLWTGAIDLAIAESTDDSDIAVDRRLLSEDPLLEDAMTRAGFHRNLEERAQPGAWISPSGVPVDLMLPEAQSDPGGRRAARIPPHSSDALRRTVGLEAAVVSNEETLIAALDDSDRREFRIKVARPGALIVAKLHKLGERVGQGGNRLDDKDAHDLYRLLVAVRTVGLADELRMLVDDDLAGDVTHRALEYLRELFAEPDALGAVMAGRAEEGVGEPATVAAAVSTLASDLLAELGQGRRDDGE